MHASVANYWRFDRLHWYILYLVVGCTGTYVPGPSWSVLFHFFRLNDFQIDSQFKFQIFSFPILKNVDMKLSIFSLLLATVSAEKVVDLEGSISTESAIGKRILSKARALDQNNNY
jgi:hypothetical protein